MLRFAARALPEQESNVGECAGGRVGGIDPAGIRNGNTTLSGLLDQPDSQIVVGDIAMREDDLPLRRQRDQGAGRQQDQKPQDQQQPTPQAF